MDSNRQIIRNDAAMKRPRKNQGAHDPVASIHRNSQFKRAQLTKRTARWQF